MAATPRQERKVVTILFADLVGFTSRAESLDPEDVVGILEPYYDYLRNELERFGGTVEKFIGDAVMAVFGAPVAHEDDAERAVRAGLAIRDWAVEQGDLQLRVAVNTGEALVTLDARPEQGRGIVAGDVVNTAARLQAAAPVNGVLVGEATRRATGDRIDYGESPPVEAKGKAEPVPVWEALRPRASLGIDLGHAPRAPLVGRRRELDALSDALARARQSRSPQLVTLVGVPGIGKSRLVHELLGVAERDEELIVWRQGRSLPYGEGVAFWALGEMVKAQAGILETDDDDTAADKLRRSVAELVDDPRQLERIVQHLRPLAGLGGEHELGEDRRGEAFAVWRRFFEALADRSTTVLVFEDLHWADDGLLDFVDHLVDWATDVPLLVVATARPELLDRRPGWGGGKRDAATLSLAPLTDEETASLLANLLERSVLPAETQTALLQRAGGNPLYAEQFARMLSERPGDDLPLPETVQGIIAARLDGLEPEAKELLQDAAVVGKVFWSGTLAAFGVREREAVERSLHALERKEFVQRARRSSVADETEYAFRHVLVRDVAYNQIPRALRSAKHQGAAAWIESLGRRDDHAEMLAYHYVQALELARASSQPVEELEQRTRLALRAAGDRAQALNALAAAARFYLAATELWPRDDPERPALLLRYVRSTDGDANLRDVLVEEARDGFLAAGDFEAAAEAEALWAFTWWVRGNRAEIEAHLDRALALVPAEAEPMRAYLLSQVSRFAMLAEDTERAIAVGREALALAERHALIPVQARSLNNIGCARISGYGDRGGFDDLERAQAIAAGEAVGEELQALSNRASMLALIGELRRARELWLETEELAAKFGHDPYRRWATAEDVIYRYWFGEWEAARAGADSFIAAAGGEHYMATVCHDQRALMRLAAGDGEGALADSAESVRLSRRIRDPQSLDVSLAWSGFIAIELGRTSEAAAVLDELLTEWRGRRPSSPGAPLTSAWVARALGRDEELRALLAGLERPTRWMVAATHVCAGELREAADVCAAMPALPEEAYARLHAAEQLVDEGRRPEADEQLARALAFYRSVGASRYVREGEALLAATA